MRSDVVSPHGLVVHLSLVRKALQVPEDFRTHEITILWAAHRYKSDRKGA